MAFSNVGFTNWNWLDFGTSLLAGFVSAGFATGIGETASILTQNPLLQAGFQAGTHRVVGGISSASQGGNFGAGLLTGAAGSLLGSATAGLGGGVQIGSSAVFGGTVSAVFGGNFWQGAAQAGIVAGFNHFMHQLQDNPIERLRRRILADGNLTLEESYQWWRRAGGRSIEIDASKLDLGWINDDEWEQDGLKRVQTLFMSDKGRVHGRVTLQRIDAHRARILDAFYDFEVHEPYWSEPVRNPINDYGRWRANDYGRQIGTRFMIIYNGAALINQPRNNIPPHIYMFN